MLAADDQMRWWGLDVRSRRRRRWMTVGSYVVLAAMLLGAGTGSRWMAHPYIVFWSLIGLSAGWERLSIFGKNGPLKERDRPSIQLGKMGRYVRVGGLDDRARYRFGVDSFDAASEEQKSELLNTYKVGTYWMPKDRDKTPWLDEREQRDMDSAERWALNMFIRYLATWIGVFFVDTASHGGKLDGYSVVTNLMFGLWLAATLPKARVLWTDPDPREFGGEIALVERPEGGL